MQNKDEETESKQSVEALDEMIKRVVSRWQASIDAHMDTIIEELRTKIGGRPLDLLEGHARADGQ